MLLTLTQLPLLGAIALPTLRRRLSFLQHLFLCSGSSLFEMICAIHNTDIIGLVAPHEQANLVNLLRVGPLINLVYYYFFSYIFATFT